MRKRGKGLNLVISIKKLNFRNVLQCFRRIFSYPLRFNEKTRTLILLRVSLLCKFDARRTVRTALLSCHTCNCTFYLTKISSSYFIINNLCKWQYLSRTLRPFWYTYACFMNIQKAAEANSYFWTNKYRHF